jgi:serine/threonine-protein kinase HipA
MRPRPTEVELAQVFCDEDLAGQLARTERGSRFSYEPKFLERCRARGWGLGFCLPLEASVETEGVNLHAFFAGLLPEGLRLETLTRKTKTSPDDLFSLLLGAGPETIGDVRVSGSGSQEPGEPLVKFDRTGSAPSFDALLVESLDYPRSKERHSLPGVQPKLSALMMTVPMKVAGSKSSSGGPALLKLEPPSLPRLLQNEAFFMRWARTCGLEVADTRLVADAQGRPGLLVERFDRRPQAPHRLHSEDGCQFLNRYPADKYRLSFEQLGEAVSRFASAPPLELVRLLELLAFSYLIANGDLHARNVSLLVGSDGRCRLSPAYDLLATLPYGDKQLALKVLGRNDNLKRSHFRELAQRFLVQPRAVVAMLDRLCDRLPPCLAALEEIGLDARKTAHLRRVMSKRRDELGRA